MLKIYSEIDCTLHVQSYGSNFLMALKGSEENINLVFNGLYNYGGTQHLGTEECPLELDFRNHTRTLATFWSSPEKMLNFFRNLFFHRNQVNIWLDFEDELCKRIKGYKGGFKAHPEYASFEKMLFDERDTYAKEQLRLLQEHSAITIVPHGKSEENFGEATETFGQGRVSAERPDDNVKDSALNSALGNRETVVDTE